MRRIGSAMFFLIFFSCSSLTQEPPRTPIANAPECVPGNDTINIVRKFSTSALANPGHFQRVTDFIVKMGELKPRSSKNGAIIIENTENKRYGIVYDTCNGKKWIRHNYILENIPTAKITFDGKRSNKNKGFPLRISIEQWQFINNRERDSAFNILKYVYQYPNNLIVYEKRYSQFVLADRRLLIVEAGSKSSETYALRYARLIDSFLKH